MPDWPAVMMKLAQERGMDVIPWFEWGFKIPAGSQLESIYRNKGWLLPGSISSPEAARYLNISMPEVADHIIQMNIDFVKAFRPKAIQWDDHLSVSSKLSENTSQLRNMLTKFVGRLKNEVKAASPGLKFQSSHHNPYWASTKFLSEWGTWGLDGVFVQLFNTVPSSFSEDLRKTIAAKGAVGVGIFINKGSNALSNSELKERLSSQVSKVTSFNRKLGIVLFNYNAIKPSQYSIVANILRPLSGVHAKKVTEQVPTQSAGSASKIEAAESVESVKTEELLPALIAEKDGNQECSSENMAQNESIEKEFTAVERCICKRGQGGETTCLKGNKWNRKFYCERIKPLSLSNLHGC
jgi:uncharacterized lipoprotein YddW (UPF0748 family)